MFRLIYRQRRRLLFGWFFFLLTVMTMFLRTYGVDMSVDGQPFYFWPVIIAAAVAMTGAVFAVVAVFIVIFPRWRQIVELLFFNTFIIYTLDPAGKMADFSGITHDYNGFLNFLLFMGIFSVTYGVALDRFRFRLDWKTRRRVHVARAPEEVWPAFAAAEYGAGPNWTPILHEITADPDDPDSFDVTYTMGSSIYQHQTQTVLQSEAPAHYRYHFIGDIDAKNRALTEGVFDVTLEDDGKGGCYVTADQHHNAMLPRDALALWFDDQLGDALDGFAARIKGRRDWSITGVAHRKILSLS